LSRIVLVGSNLVTAALAVLLTTMFWVGRYGQEGPGVASRPSAMVVPPEPPLPATAPPSSPAPNLWLGPTGVAIPVAGVKPGELLDTFTQARAGGRVHDAIDIMAPAGTPVIAAAPGIVEKLFFSNGGGGITAYVRSPDGRWSYYYAHLQEYAPSLKEGALIKRGDPIGKVGSTGDANPAAPHLHFAINRMEAGDRWWQGTPINPYPLLAGNKAPS
jgi:murein DD-endopeptidase MepM/ murein hydrolase activator NlpD